LFDLGGISMEAQAWSLPLTFVILSLSAMMLSADGYEL
jgi:hypothetical protein